MKPPQGEERVPYVRHMFARIARRYDLLNRLMTFGRDRAWRSEAIHHLQPQTGQCILDLGSGTGDLALQIQVTTPGTQVIAADLTLEMMMVGKQRPGGDHILWVVADAGHLPFDSEIFDGVVSGYLLRNVPDVDATLAEHHRVTTCPSSGFTYDLSSPCWANW
jgi:demethylmenaquinone methyltransferase/2-methoxy-6-polyprenyl-1,4-benzoquinol methylase